MIIWVLACNNTYRHDRHFVSVYCNSTILETDLIASKWFHTDLIQNLFIEIQRQEIILDINQYVNDKSRLHFLISYILSVDAMGNILKDLRHVVKHLPTTSVISKMNIIDSGYVNLTQWWYFFIIFEYILHISTPHIMIFCFPLPYFPLSTSALFFA